MNWKELWVESLRPDPNCRTAGFKNAFMREVGDASNEVEPGQLIDIKIIRKKNSTLKGVMAIYEKWVSY